MQQNCGMIDRAIRIVVGLVFLAMTYYWSFWWILLAALFMLTGATGVCLVYIPLKINTNK